MVLKFDFVKNQIKFTSFSLVLMSSFNEKYVRLYKIFACISLNIIIIIMVYSIRHNALLLRQQKSTYCCIQKVKLTQVVCVKMTDI